MTNELDATTNTINLVTQSHVSITPQAVAYTFKEWMGVIGLILTSMYTGAHVVFMAVTHYGGLRKMWSDFIGKKIEVTQLEPITSQRISPSIPTENK